MKKRNLLLALVMSLVMLFTACGGEKANSFVGKWVGTLDLTDYIVQEMVAEDATMEQYAKFENLTFTFVFEFAENEVSLHLDEASTQQFIANAEAGVTSMVDAMVADLAADNNVTAEDIYAGMNVTRESFIQSSIDSMDIDAIVSAMAESLVLSGSYETDDETITVIYEDNTYEEMKYTLDGDKLAITVSDGTNDFVINCTKEVK